MNTLIFNRVPDTTTAEQKHAIYLFALDHLLTFGALPVDVELETDGEDETILLSYDQMLSALSDEQISDLSIEYAAIENAQQKGCWVPQDGAVTSQIIGNFVDSVAGNTRTPSAVAGRLLEEVVELCLAAGLSGGDIQMHVTDALHNQSLKASAKANKTVFPSKLAPCFNPEDLSEEIADVGIVLKDLVYVCDANQNAAEVDKWNKFTRKNFRVSPEGTLYATKVHIKESSLADLQQEIESTKENISRLEKTISSNSFSAGYIHNCNQALASHKETLAKLEQRLLDFNS